MAKPSETKKAPQPIKVDLTEKLQGNGISGTVPYLPEPVYGSIYKVDNTQLPEEPSVLAQGFGKADRERRQS